MAVRFRCFLGKNRAAVNLDNALLFLNNSQNPTSVDLATHKKTKERRDRYEHEFMCVKAPSSVFPHASHDSLCSQDGSSGASWTESSWRLQSDHWPAHDAAEPSHNPPRDTQVSAVCVTLPSAFCNLHWNVFLATRGVFDNRASVLFGEGAQITLNVLLCVSGAEVSPLGKIRELPRTRADHTDARHPLSERLLCFRGNVPRGSACTDQVHIVEFNDFILLMLEKKKKSIRFNPMFHVQPAIFQAIGYPRWLAAECCPTWEPDEGRRAFIRVCFCKNIWVRFVAKCEQ